MSSIIKTRTQGFRVSTFRNQEVHKYYNHLQSVMRSIDSNGTYSDLFAKPEIDAMAVGETEIEWTCSSSSKAVHLSQLSDAERNRVEKIVSDAYSRIDAYIAENRTKSGKNRDYAQFLSIVGKRPDPNQIWVVNGKPVIVQWGFVDENGLMGSSGIYSDWDSFIKDIRKAEPEKPKEEPVKVVEEPAKTENLNEAVVAAPAAASSLFAEQEKVAEPASQPKPEEPQPKPAEKKEEPKPAPKKVDTEQKKTVYAGLGSYEWVKWVAILLAIIILLLLLLRLLFPPRFPNDLFGQNGTNIGAINGGGMGGSGGGMGGSDGGGMGGGNGAGGQGGGDNGSGGQGGGDNGSGGQNGGGNPAINPNEPCPVCSKPFGNHGPEDYKKCIRQASKSGQGNGGAAGSQAGAGQGAGGDGQGSPSGADGQGGANGASGVGQGSPSGADGQGGANGSGGAGQGSPSGAGSQGGANGTSGAGQGSPSGVGSQGGANGTGGDGQGSLSGAGSQGGAKGTGGDDQGSLSGAGSQGGANGTGGDDQGSLSGAGSQGGAKGTGGDDQGSLSGAGSQGGANGTGGQGDSDENAVESSKQQKDDDKGFNPEDICPVCNRQFLLHDEEDLKNCILASQRDKIEVQKKFEKLKSATTNYNKAVKKLNSENSAESAGE